MINAASLTVTTLSTAALGVAFWAVATRKLDQAQVGSASALVSAMTLVGTIAMLGYGSLLISELPRRRVNAASLITTVATAVTLLGLVLGGVWVLGLRRTPELGHLISRPEGLVLFVVGSAVTGTTLVLDQATIGLLRGSLQMWRNLLHSVLKIALLLPLLFIGPGIRGLAPLAAWAIATAVSVPFVVVLAQRTGAVFVGRLRPRLLAELGRETWDHTLLTLAMVAPRMCLPVVVAVAVSAEANASFYIAYTIAGMLSMVPNHLATVLFAVGRGDVRALKEKLGFTLGISFAVGLPVVAAVALAGKLLLSIFGAAYAEGGYVPLCLLLSMFPPTVVCLHYAAVQRVRGHLSRAWRILLVGAAAEVAAVGWFGHAYGLNSAMVALACVTWLEGLVTAPTVLSALRARPA